MIEFSASDLRDLCGAGAVRAQISTLEERRRRAVRHFWMFLVVGTVLGIAILMSLAGNGWPGVGLLLGLAVIIGGIVLGLRPMNAAREELKLPVLEALAARGGLEYVPEGFDPPVYPSAAKLLFGAITSYSFSDLFHGKDEEGRRFAVYEGTLMRRAGKNTQTVFSGQLYAFQRRSSGGGEIAIVPDKGLFNFLKPSGMERVKFESDPAFERRFEVYSSQPATALGLVDGNLRRTLLQLRETHSRVLVYVGPEDVLVGLWGRNRFEAGSMFRSRTGEERVRQMFDDLCGSLAVLRSLRSSLD